MAEESDIEESDIASDEKGVFHVSQILPIQAEEELKPQAEDAETEVEEEPPADGDEDKCTYQLGPATRVRPKRLTTIAQRILKEYLVDKSYNESDMKEYARKISFAIREAVKRLGLDRYRVVCQVTIGQKCNQDVAMAFLCLWKHEFDHYAVATYDNETFFATAVIFVVYKQ